jgi:hypothetical protein
MLRSLTLRSRCAAGPALAHYHLAAVLVKGGDLARAKREYQLGLKQDP